MNKNNQLADLTQKIEAFRTARNWQQFHNLKDMIISLNLESAELLELVQWKTSDELLSAIADNPETVTDELADIFYWLLIIASDLKIDLAQAFEQKMQKNEQKYPVASSLNCKTKYNQKSI